MRSVALLTVIYICVGTEAVHTVLLDLDDISGTGVDQNIHLGMV